MKKFLKIPERDTEVIAQVMHCSVLRSFARLCNMTPFSLSNLLHEGFIKFSAIHDNGISINKEDLWQQMYSAAGCGNPVLFCA